MKQLFAILSIIFFYSCVQKSETNKTGFDVVSKDSFTNKQDTAIASRKMDNSSMEQELAEWEKHEDSLKEEILKKKENRILKGSFLQEMYIRNVVTVSKDSLFFEIPFNLHGPDCGAPDCYSTDISFRFRLGNVLTFPKVLSVDEHEHGCVPAEKHLKMDLQLVEQTDKYVIYHSVRQKRVLALMSSNEYCGTTAYYFSGVGQNSINGKNLFNIEKDYDDEDEKPVYPFKSFILTRNEYEPFIK
ncbi:MAG: hypothetical protein DI535_20240 [Citrobacter freundii]|nr:MAG: hypothetical protein DI535_20240 [Citrobacter freundii]